MTLSAIEVRELPEQPTACVRRSLRYNQVSTVSALIADVREALAARNVGPAGEPYLRILSLGLMGMDIEVGWPVDAPFTGAGEVTSGTLPGGRAAVASYFGPYGGTRGAYEAIAAWCKEHGHAIAGTPWESYFTDSNEEPDSSNWRTDIAFPLKGE